MHTTNVSPQNSSNRLSSVLALVGWVALAFAASLGGVIWMPGEWYQGLTKPTWNPPGWVFGPVWTTLYFMMGTSAWLVWSSANSKPALGLFVLQLLLNAAWTPVFFGLHQPGWALVVIVFLWIALAGTIAAFRKHSKPAAALLLPYLAWISFATALNYTLWSLN